MRTRSINLALAGFATAATLLLTGAAPGVQPVDAPPLRSAAGDRADAPQPGGARSRGERELLRQLMSLPPEERRARLRSFLTERRERARRIEEAIEKAIRKLDDGAPLDDLASLIPAEARDLRGGGPPPFGPLIDGITPPSPGDEPASDAGELGPVSLPGMTGPSRGPRTEENPPKPFEGPITDEDRAVVNEFLSSAAPHLLDMFRQFEEKSPERAEARMRETLSRIRWMIDLRKSDRAEYDLRLEDIRHGREAFDAARDLARFDRAGQTGGDSEQRDVIVGRMRTALSEQYRVRGELMARSIARLESDLSQRKLELTKRDESRESTIARTMERLTERATEFMKRRERGKKGREDTAN